MTQLQNLSKDKHFLRKTMWSFLFGSGVCFTNGKNDGPGHGQHDDRLGQRTVSG